MRALTFARLAKANRRHSTHKNSFRLIDIAAGLALVQLTATAQNRSILPAKNPSGVAATLTTSGNFDFNNPFFKSLGTDRKSVV